MGRDRARSRLRKALGELRIEFDRWERGEIDSFELNERVHRFHQDPSREIWKRYATTHLEPAIASAVVNGVLRKEELPPAVVQHITGLIQLYEHDFSPPRAGWAVAARRMRSRDEDRLLDEAD